MEERTKIAALLEQLPRLAQTLNLIREMPEEVIDKLEDKETLYKLRKLEINYPKDLCLPIPKSNALDSTVRVIDFIEGGYLVFNYKGKLQVMTKDTIQVQIRQFFLMRDGTQLKPHYGDDIYTPTVLNFTVVDWDNLAKLGMALVSGPCSKLRLIDENNVIRQFNISDIGFYYTINPLDAYLVK